MASIYLANPGIQEVSKPFTPMLVQDLKHIGIVGLKYTWSHGVFKNDHRKTENFLWSKFVVFDVDNKGEEIYTLEQAISDWCDSQCIIVASRNHQKEKNGYPPQDRFRIITEWEEVITDADTFKYSYGLACKANPAFDTSCKDCTHMFFPHRAVLFENYEGFKQPVRKPEPEAKSISQAARQLFYKKSNKIPLKVEQFLKKGIIWDKGRNHCVYSSTLTLLEVGTPPEKVLELLEKSPFDRQEFSTHELMKAYTNALKKFVQS